MRPFLRQIPLRLRMRRAYSDLSKTMRYDSKDLFEYTSGRYIFNEKTRRAERHLTFNANALAEAICHSVRRPLANLASIKKFAEGGFNRVLEATFDDGYSVLARIPFPMTTPSHYAVASEVATLDLLQFHGIPVPKVLGYSAVSSNPVGIEYILLEKIQGTPLSEQWFSMGTKTQVKVMKQIVDLEKRFLGIKLPASGSLYYRRDLTESEDFVPVSGTSGIADEIVVGPSAQYEWWYKERAALRVDRGPWTDFLACMEAPAKRELEICQKYGKPRQHVEIYLREIHEFQQMSPTLHTRLLSDFLTLAPHLELPPTHRFSRPVLRHPDFSPSNIIVTPSNDIVGILDWQHAAVLPLCLIAGIPKHFQNWGDPPSDKLEKPETQLPDNFQNLSAEEQESVRETIRKRLVHFYYAASMMRHFPDHFDAFRDGNAMLRAKLFDRAGAPWEGDSISLKYAIIQAQSQWPMHLKEENNSSRPASAKDGEEIVECPIKYSGQEIKQCIDLYKQENEKMQELEEMRELLGTDALGWVPTTEHLNQSKDMVQVIKTGMLEHSSTEIERIAVHEHFPFDDHDEDE